MKGKILVIEDDAKWKSLLNEFLSEARYHVTIVDNLQDALTKTQYEKFHFITIDMQLNQLNLDKFNFEGWDILEVIKKLRMDYMTPTMVITGFGIEYVEVKPIKKLEGVFFMEKGEFDRVKFIEIIDRSITNIDMHFHDDHRDE